MHTRCWRASTLKKVQVRCVCMGYNTVTGKSRMTYTKDCTLFTELLEQIASHGFYALPVLIHTPSAHVGQAGSAEGCKWPVGEVGYLFLHPGQCITGCANP